MAPFQPGQSGNPSGRPKNAVSKFLRELGNEITDGATRNELLAKYLWDSALKAGVEGKRKELAEMASLILDRMEGKPRNVHEFGSPGDDISPEVVEANIRQLKAELGLTAESGNRGVTGVQDESSESGPQRESGRHHERQRV